MTKSILLSKWINKKYLHLDYCSTLHKRFAANSPFEHIVLEDIFVTEKFIALRNSTLSQSFQQKDSDLFSFYQTNDLLFSKNLVIREFISLLLSKEFANLISGITDVSILHKKTDCSGFIYSKKDYLLCHDDRLDNRAIAYVLYLNDDFNIADGGALCLYNVNSKNRPTDINKKIIPKQNSLVLFKVSNKSFHSVQEVIGLKNRITLTGWFYGK